MSDPFYRTARWRRLRELALSRHPLCVTPGCGALAVVADHVIPRSRGGADSLENLVGRCLRCHNARRGTGEPRLRGCDPAGMPRDRGHWWHQPAPGRGAKIRSGLDAESAPGAPREVSSRPGQSGFREGG